MNLNDFEARLKEATDKVRSRGFFRTDIDVMITKSTGKTLFCIMHDSEVIDYFEVK